MKINKSKLIIVFLIIIFVVGARLALFIWKKPSPKINQENSQKKDIPIDILNLKCPDEYATSKERESAWAQFSNDYDSKHPNASGDEWMDARRQFFIERNCEKALIRFGLYLSKRTNFEFIELLDSDFVSDFGFSFQHSWDYEVFSKMPEDPETLTVKSVGDTSEVYSGIVKEQANDNFIIIVARENPQGATAMDWLKSEYSGYNFSNGYQEKQINGVNVLLLFWRDPKQIDGALFITPDGKRRVTMTTLGDTKLLLEEFNKIVDSLSFE